jgi:hypothetical protein
MAESANRFADSADHHQASTRKSPFKRLENDSRINGKWGGTVASF